MEELKVTVTQTPGKIKCNLDEIKEALAVQMTAYSGLEITEDNVKTAKKDLAVLRKIRTAVDTRRKEIKNEFMAPYEQFEAQVKEVLAVIDKPIGEIDKEVKSLDAKRAALKMEHIKDLYLECLKDYIPYLPLEKVFKESWLNATVKDKDIKYDMSEAKVKVQSDLDVIHGLNSEIEDEILEIYRNNDNNLAMAIKRNSDYVSDKIKIQKDVKPKAEAMGALNDMVEMTKTAHIIVSKEDLQQAINCLDFADIKYQVLEG